MNDKTRLFKGAEYYASNQWHVFPCHGIVDGRCTCGKTEDPTMRGKHPASAHGQKDATTDGATVAGWWDTNPHYNVGVFCRPSGFFVLDIDPRSGGLDSFDKLEALLDGEIPPTVEAQTGIYSVNGREVRGRHLYFKYNGTDSLVGNLKAANMPGIDIKSEGYVLAPPSMHASGVEYEWREGRAPWEMEMAEAPESLMEAIRKRGGASGGVSGRLTPADWAAFEKIDLGDALEKEMPDGERNVGVYRLACSVANTVNVEEEVGRMMVETTMIRYNAEKIVPPLPMDVLLNHVQRAIEYVRKNPKSAYKPELEEWQKDAAKRMQEGTFREASKSVENIEKPASPSVPDYEADMYTAPGTVGGAVANAAMSGMSAADASSLLNMDVPNDVDALTAEEGGTPGKRSLSDTGNGRRLVDSFGTIIRYTSGIGWFYWSGSHWNFDQEALSMKELSKKIAPLISSESVNYNEDERMKVYKWADQSRSSSRINSGIEAAKTDPRIVVPVKKWDADPYLFGVSNGVVDLRTGELFKGRPDLHITKKSPVAYIPGATNARWQKFLDDATGGDRELQDWIQRAAGYALTGLNHLDYMFLVYGPPGSGKNTFVETLVKCLGTNQYSWTLDSEVLGEEKNSNTAEYHWAQLVGKRMVWADELPEGERLKENQVKKLTGSDEIPARSPGESPFVFTSQAKLWITTNHRPMISDDAMWRRIRPIPWVHVPEVPDPGLKEYLFDPQGGLPAVLAWMVEGAIKFLSAETKDGLGWCRAVYEAAEVYRKSEDRIGLFLEEQMDESATASCPMSQLHQIYRYWAEERGERPLAMGKFERRLKDRGLNLVGTGSNAILYGYGIMRKTIPSSSVSVADVSFLASDGGVSWNR